MAAVMNARMLPGMRRLTIAVPDDLADKIRAAAGGNVSAWLTELARRQLLREEAAAAVAYDHATADTEWDTEREREWAA
jgi:hypothetical protein